MDTDDDRTKARMECERWLDTHPGWQVAFHDVCMWCPCDCKDIYHFHGVTGQHGMTYRVDYLCPVLWLFHPRNPLRRSNGVS